MPEEKKSLLILIGSGNALHRIAKHAPPHFDVLQTDHGKGVKGMFDRDWKRSCFALIELNEYGDPSREIAMQAINRARQSHVPYGYVITSRAVLEQRPLGQLAHPKRSCCAQMILLFSDESALGFRESMYARLPHTQPMDVLAIKTDVDIPYLYHRIHFWLTE